VPSRFASKRKSTVIAEGLKIIGNVSADGAIEVNGQVDGDLDCTSLTVSPKAFINGGINARSVVVNGKVEGPINGQDVVLKSHAFVTGDIQAQSLSIERGAHFEGRSLRPEVTNLRSVESPASNGHGERIRPAVVKKEEEPKTKVARA
jgi:cytoskeletal protein CcmA (bactofilin family)